MFGFFRKSDPNESRKVNLFQSVLEKSPQKFIARSSYRQNGKFEIIFDGSRISDLTSPMNQAIFNLLAHAWMIIWGNDKAELHVGITNRPGFRVEVDASKLYIGHKFEDHDTQLKTLLSSIGNYQ
jgi:hypothetical protein